MRLSERH